LSEFYPKKVGAVPMSDLASWGSLTNLGAFNRPNVTLRNSGCMESEYNRLFDQVTNDDDGLNSVTYFTDVKLCKSLFVKYKLTEAGAMVIFPRIQRPIHNFAPRGKL
jgi:hypothetical protein